MYFPFLRGKRENYFAVIESNRNIYNNGIVIHIIEPVSSPSRNVLQRLIDHDISSIIITNPFVGDMQPNTVYDIIHTGLADHKNIIAGFNVNNSAGQRQLQRFFTNCPDHDKAIIFHQDNEVIADILLDSNESIK